MPQSISQQIRRIVAAFMAVIFLATTLTPSAVAQKAPSYPATVKATPTPKVLQTLPPVGTRIGLTEKYSPANIRGLTIYPDNPLQFDFIMDTGDDDLAGAAFEAESQKIIKYFLAALTVPENELWVNLSPYEKDRIIPEGLGTTELGMEMLAQDYILKQLFSSLSYPEDNLGARFWQMVRAKAREMYGTDNIAINTFNKIWIVPDKAAVYEKEGSVFVVERHLKVMLENDYLALEKNLGNKNLGLVNQSNETANQVNDLSAKVVKEIVLPAIEKEINEGKNFAELRQIYNAMILATWYKKTLKASLLGQVYMDKNKTKGVDIDDRTAKEKLYEQYLIAFKKGVYNYIRQDYDVTTGQTTPRKYFSGGLGVGVVTEEKLQTIHGNLAQLPRSVSSAVMKPESKNGKDRKVTTRLLENAETGKEEFAKVYFDQLRLEQQNREEAARNGQESEDTETVIIPMQALANIDTGVLAKIAGAVNEEIGILSYREQILQTAAENPEFVPASVVVSEALAASSSPVLVNSIWWNIHRLRKYVNLGGSVSGSDKKIAEAEENLVRFGKSALPALLKFSQEGWVMRWHVVGILDKMGVGVIKREEDVFELLTKIVSDPDEFYVSREYAVSLLSELGDKRALDALLIGLLQEPGTLRISGPDSYASYISYYLRFIDAIAVLGDQRAIEPLMKKLNAWPREIWPYVTVALQKLNATEDQLVTAYIATLNCDTNENYFRREIARIKEEVVFKLGKLLHNPRVVELLLAKLGDEDENIREVVTVILKGSKETQALMVTGYIAALNSKSADAQKKAAIELGVIGNPQAVEPLLAQVYHRVGGVRAVVREALKQLGSKDNRLFISQQVDAKLKAAGLSEYEVDKLFPEMLAIVLSGDDFTVFYQPGITTGGEYLGSVPDDSFPPHSGVMIPNYSPTVEVQKRILNITRIPKGQKPSSPVAGEISSPISDLAQIGSGVALVKIAGAVQEETLSIYHGGIQDVSFVSPLNEAGIINEHTVTGALVAGGIAVLYYFWSKYTVSGNMWTVRNITKDKNINTTLNAIKFLVEKKVVKAVPLLLEKLDIQNSSVRVAVSEALGNLGDKKAIDLLLVRLGDKESPVRDAARKALEQLGVTQEQLVKGYFAAFDSDFGEARKDAVERLVEMGTAVLVKFIQGQPNSREKSIRRFLVALAQTGDSRIESVLRGLEVTDVLVFAEADKTEKLITEKLNFLRSYDPGGDYEIVTHTEVRDYAADEITTSIIGRVSSWEDEKDQVFAAVDFLAGHILKDRTDLLTELRQISHHKDRLVQVTETRTSHVIYQGEHSGTVESGSHSQSTTTEQSPYGNYLGEAVREIEKRLGNKDSILENKPISLAASDNVPRIDSKQSEGGPVVSSPVAGQGRNEFGGINLNAELLNLQIKRDGNGIPLPLPQQPIQNMKIEGFLPVIINIEPISIQLLLGVTEEQPADVIGMNVAGK